MTVTVAVARSSTKFSKSPKLASMCIQTSNIPLMEVLVLSVETVLLMNLIFHISAYPPLLRFW